MKPIIKKQVQRERRKRRVRKNVIGTPERPRLTVFRSHKNIYAQIIDDSMGATLVASSTMEKASRGQLNGASGGNKAAAMVVGSSLAAKAVEKGIRKVVFDRNGYPFHGRIKDLAEAARKGGLEF
ncbi:MAG: 50S ribosomal protein L18 [Phycisphaerae bacterium]|nr:50S ribosomal protein L18 [Phycisphaerae bacterium]